MRIMNPNRIKETILAFILVFILLLGMVASTVQAQDVVINEFLASNQTGIEDEKLYDSQLKQNEAQMSVEVKRMFDDAFSGAGRGDPPPREDLHAYHAWLVRYDEYIYGNFRSGYSEMQTLTFGKSSLLETLHTIRLDLLLLVLWMGLGFVFATLAVVKCEVW